MPSIHGLRETADVYNPVMDMHHTVIIILL